MNNKVKFLRGTSNEYAVAEKDSDTIYFTTDDGKLYIGDKEVSGDGSITIDNTLSDTSTNPVQNKIVKQAIDNKADKSKYGDSTINVGRKAETDVGEYSTAEGQTTTASGAYSHAEGYKTIASGIGSYAEGSNYFLSGVSSSRKVTISNGEESTIYTIDGSYAYGINSHAEGTRSFAYGSSSHAEGCDTTASGSYSHAEGRDTTASGAYSHAEGDFITASGTYSHAEGYRTIASGSSSHAEGCYTTAGGRYSHAGGYYTKALKVAEFAHGQYNQSNNNTLFSIGDGTADDARHNAFEITTTGGKLHDKDIATTDLIPTTLPANGGNADTVGGKSPSDFLPFQAYAPIYTGDIKDISNMGTYSCYKGNCTNLPDIYMWAYVIMIRFRDVGYKTFLCIEFNARSTTQHCRNIYIAREYDVDSSGNMIWYKSCDGGNAATVNGRSAFRIPTLDGSGNLWDASTPNVNDLYAQWDASKRYFKLKTFGGNNVAVDIATSNTASGTITGLSNGTAKSVSLPFSPVFVLFHSNGHVVQSGFALSCGTNSFTITPANVTAMGTTAVGYIAFGG